MAQGPLHNKQPDGLPTEVSGAKPAPDGVKDTSRSDSPARNRGRNASTVKKG